jgi:hypothetical protein
MLRYTLLRESRVILLLVFCRELLDIDIVVRELRLFIGPNVGL